jgi:hypothetical protein
MTCNNFICTRTEGWQSWHADRLRRTCAGAISIHLTFALAQETRKSCFALDVTVCKAASLLNSDCPSTTPAWSLKADFLALRWPVVLVQELRRGRSSGQGWVVRWAMLVCSWRPKEVRLFYFYFMHATTYDSDSASGLVSVKEVVSLIWSNHLSEWGIVSYSFVSLTELIHVL